MREGVSLPEVAPVAVMLPLAHALEQPEGVRGALPEKLAEPLELTRALPLREAATDGVGAAEDEVVVVPLTEMHVEALKETRPLCETTPLGDVVDVDAPVLDAEWVAVWLGQPLAELVRTALNVRNDDAVLTRDALGETEEVGDGEPAVERDRVSDAVPDTDAVVEVQRETDALRLRGPLAVAKEALAVTDAWDDADGNDSVGRGDLDALREARELVDAVSVAREAVAPLDADAVNVGRDADGRVLPETLTVTLLEKEADRDAAALRVGALAEADSDAILGVTPLLADEDRDAAALFVAADGEADREGRLADCVRDRSGVGVAIDGKGDVVAAAEVDARSVAVKSADGETVVVRESVPVGGGELEPRALMESVAEARDVSDAVDVARGDEDRLPVGHREGLALLVRERSAEGETLADALQDGGSAEPAGQ